MKNVFAVRKLLVAVMGFVLILYFLCKTTSHKIIFVPFLFCSFTSAGKYLGVILNKIRAAEIFDKLFKVSFFVFWFGFLIFAAFISIRDKNYSMLIFTLPFFAAGIYFVVKKFRKKVKEY